MADLREEEVQTSQPSNVNEFVDATPVETNEVVFDTNLYKNLGVYQSPDLNTALSRWTLIGNADWVTTTPIDTNLFSFNPISSLLFKSPFISDKMSDFDLFRCTVEVEFRVNTSPISAGLAMVAWVYSGRGIDMDDLDAEQLSNLPHLIFDMSKQSVLRLTIPFKQCVDWYDASVYDNRPAVIMKSITGFHSGDATNVNHACISVFARMVDVELAAPKDVVPQSSMTTVPVSNAEIEHESVFETKTLKDGLSCVELMTGKESNTAQQVVPHFRLRSFGPLNQVDMPNTSEKLAMLKDGYHYMDHELLGDPVDYDNIITYGQLPGLLPGLSFSDAVNHGEFITMFHCEPSDTPFYHHEVPLSAFELYRGSWKFHFRFVCSKFTTARVLFVWLPPKMGSRPTSAEDAISRFETRVVDIQGTTSVDIEVPYLRTEPWMPTQSLHSRLAIYAVNPPINPNGTEADSIIEVRTWRSLGSDMQYAQPHELRFTTVNPSLREEKITPQSIDDCDMRAHFREAFPPITPIIGKTVRFNLSGNDQICYWTDFLKRFQSISATIPVIQVHSLNKYNWAVYSWLAYFQTIFTRSSGCIRMKFMDGHNPYQVWREANPPGNTTLLFSGHAVTDSTAPNAEIEVPCSIPYHFVDNFYLQSRTTYWPHISLPSGAGFYIAAGEDYTLGFPALLPTLYPL